MSFAISRFPTSKVVHPIVEQLHVTVLERQNRAGGVAREQRRMGTISLRREDEIDAIRQDITVVVGDRIGDLVAQGLLVELLAVVEAELISRADRAFLWVSLALSLLEERVEDGASRRELDAILRTRDGGIPRSTIFCTASSVHLRTASSPSATTSHHIRNKVYLIHGVPREFLLSHRESKESLWSLPSLPRPLLRRRSTGTKPVLHPPLPSTTNFSTFPPSRTRVNCCWGSA